MDGKHAVVTPTADSLVVLGSDANLPDGVVDNASIEDGSVGAEKLASSGATAGSYVNADLSIDEDGRITSASTGIVDLGTEVGGVLGSVNGGTGVDTSGATGIPKVSAGSWSVGATTDDLSEGSTNLYSQWSSDGTNVNYSGGNVSIGTSSPSEKLELGALGTATSTATQSSSGKIALTGSFWASTEESKRRFTVQNIASTTTDEDALLGFSWDASELFSVTKDGNFGIGIIAPASKLEVAGTIHSTAGGIKFPDNTTQTTAASDDNLGNHTATQNIALGSNWLSGDGGSEGMYVDGSGNVGIGTTTSSEKLHVSGGNILIDNNQRIYTKNGSGIIKNLVSLYNDDQYRFGDSGMVIRLLGHARPDIDNSYDLGDTDRKWRDLWLKGVVLLSDSDSSNYVGFPPSTFNRSKRCNVDFTFS